MRRLNRSMLALLCAVPLLALAACAGQTLDDDKIEEEISKEVEQQGQGQVQVRSVECPEDREVEANDRFTCKITAENGATTSANVIQTDDEGNVRFTANLLPLLAGGNNTR